MQLHNLKPSTKKKQRKRVGRGGKKGTYSGRGMKGQKSRAGSSVKPGFRGGDTPLWKLFPKLRGATKKLKINKRSFALHRPKKITINLKDLGKHFKENDLVSPETLLNKGIIDKIKPGVKILGQGELDKKLKFEGVEFSKSAKTKIRS